VSGEDVDLYEILGVDPTATAEEIRRAYVAAARRWHPDANADPEATFRMQLVNHARHVLLDVPARAGYDRDRARRRRRTRAPAPPPPEPPPRTGSKAAGWEARFEEERHRIAFLRAHLGVPATAPGDDDEVRQQYFGTGVQVGGRWFATPSDSPAAPERLQEWTSLVRGLLELQQRRLVEDQARVREWLLRRDVACEVSVLHPAPPVVGLAWLYRLWPWASAGQRRDLAGAVATTVLARPTGRQARQVPAFGLINGELRETCLDGVERSRLCHLCEWRLYKPPRLRALPGAPPAGTLGWRADPFTHFGSRRHDGTSWTADVHVAGPAICVSPVHVEEWEAHTARRPGRSELRLQGLYGACADATPRWILQHTTSWRRSPLLSALIQQAAADDD
jgi:hypothetical protein